MKYKARLTVSVIGILISVTAVILSYIKVENIFYSSIIITISALAAFIDIFLSIIPYILKTASIQSSQIDPNMYEYNKKCFIDRKEVFKDIVYQIKMLNWNKEKTIWIRLFGVDGIGKKTLVSKIFQTYKYPRNKFYFLSIETCTDIINLLQDKYPLKYEAFDKKIYLHQLSSARRTFIVINSDYNNINYNITELMSLWNSVIKNKSKLIFISLDSNSAISSLKNQSYIFEYELKTFSDTDSMEYINRISRHTPKLEKENIVKISNGLPATIKFICEQYNNDKQTIEKSNWLKNYLKLYDKQKNAFFAFCVLTLICNKVNKDTAERIGHKDDIKTLISMKILISTKENQYYVPVWLLNTIILSGTYEKDILYAIDMLQKKIRLNDEMQKMICILIKKDMKILYEYLKHLYTNKNFLKIKELYDKLLIKYDSNNFLEYNILLIFMQTMLKLGEYGLFNTLLQKYNIPITKDMGENDFRFNILIADYYHLTSQYDKSNDILNLLLFNTSLGSKYHLEIKFHLAHNYRHQGNLDIALKIFENIIENSDINTVHYIRSTTSVISIEYFKDADFNREKSIDILTALIENNETTKYNVYRHIANIYRRDLCTLDKAIELLQESIVCLEEIQLRILQDYYFELAECYRIKSTENQTYFNLSLTYYNKALLFAEINHDINLKISVQIGKALLEYTKLGSTSKLNKKLEKIITESKISSVIHYCILTILAILNKTDISNQLRRLGYHHYLKILESKDICSMQITVM